MTTSSTRRDFFKSAAATAAVATVAPAPAVWAEPGTAATGDAPGVSDLQLDLERAIEKYKVVGASAAVYHNRAMETAAAGVLNVTTGVEVTHDTVMHIGSITKTFNTTLVMQLVDDGLVELDAPVIKYLPDFKVKDPTATRAITVKMLLNHTSGINGELLPDHGHDEETIDKAVMRAAEMDQLFEPGTDCSYCNTAMVVAGYLAQTVRGESWYDLMKTRIFQPLGLEHAVVLPEDALLHRATVGHFLDPATGVSTRTSFAFLPVSFSPAGATAMLSARDLVSFGVAHIGNGVGANGQRILSEAGARAMRTRTSGLQGVGPTRNFGLAFMLGEGGDVGHGGGGPGILSWLSIHPEKDFAMAVLTNSAHGMTVIAEVMKPWMEKATGVDPFKSQKRPFPDIEIDTSKYAGTYEDIAAEHRISVQDGGLSFSSRAKHKFYDNVSLEPTPPAPLKPVGDHGFAFDVPGADDPASPTPQTIITFVNPMADGRMEHLATGGRLYRRTG
jgi:CubicO group peptidase (beta-lactamase class C family)